MTVQTDDLRHALAAEVETLNEKQKEAVRWQGNVTCMAGPGSGKTRTLVARIAQTLTLQANRRQAAAAITYTRAAAREVEIRLAALGFAQGKRTRVATLHSFCYQNVLRRHATLLGLDLRHPSPVLTPEETEDLERDCEIRQGIYDGRKPNDAVFTSARRALAVGEDWERFGPQRLDAVRDFESRLAAAGRFDNEQMVIAAYTAMRDQPALVNLVSARFPYLLVDEYQDLGAVLHRIVLLLLNAGTQIFAVGDADQSVMGFTGADPRYLLELAARPDFKRVDFDINYRSGTAIIEASQRILREERPYRADPNRQDPGRVVSVAVDGGQEQHGSETVAAVQRLHAQGLAYSEIAVLYPARGRVVDSVLEALGEARVPMHQERSLTTGRGPLGGFLQACAARFVAGPQPGTEGGTAASIPELVRHLQGLTVEPFSLQDERRLTRALATALRGWDAGETGASLLSRLVRDLELEALISEPRAIAYAMQDMTAQNASVEDLAGNAVVDAVTVTTYASAKGREFKAVILPGCIEGLTPRWPRTGYEMTPPSEGEIARSRAAFYVAFTRAEDEVVMISGAFWTNKGNFPEGKGHSRFVYDALGNESPYG